MYIYLISINLSHSLYLNGERSKMKILQILSSALRLRYLSQSNSTLFKVTRFIYYKVNSKKYGQFKWNSMHTSIPRLDQPGFAHWKLTGLQEFNLKVRLRPGWGRISEESLYWNKFEPTVIPSSHLQLKMNVYNLWMQLNSSS